MPTTTRIIDRAKLCAAAGLPATATNAEIGAKLAIHLDERRAAARRRDSKVSEAIASGRIHQFSAPTWRKMLDDDEQGTTVLMNSLPVVDAGTPAAVAARFSEQPATHGLSAGPVATSAFTQAAIVNAQRQEELDRIEALERAEGLRTAKALGLAW